MNYQKMRIDFTQKRGLTAPFVYKTGEIDVDGIEAELVNIDVDGSPIGFIKLISPTGIERESALRIENGFAYFDIPKNEEGLYTVELTVLNKKNKTRSGNINIEVINSLSYDSEEYETLLDTITKKDAEYTTNENVRIENESTRVSNENTRISNETKRQASITDIEKRFSNLTTAQQQQAEVVDARTDATGFVHANLKTRLDEDFKELASKIPTDVAMNGYESVTTNDTLSGEVKSMVVSGQTLVNVTVDSTKGQGANCTMTYSNGKFTMSNETITSTAQRIRMYQSLTPEAKIYTLYCIVNTKACERTVFLRGASEFVVVPPNTNRVITLKSSLGTTFSDKHEVYFARTTDSTTPSEAIEISNLIILEGDHTDKPLEFFEGLKSSEVSEIGTKNADNTKSSKTTLSEPITLRSLPNGVADTYDVDTQVLTRRCGEVVLNGSESGWYREKEIESFVEFQAPIDGIYSGVSLPFCDMFTPSTTGNFERISGYNKAVYIVIAKSKLTTPDVAGFKAWLAQNPTTVVYQLAESTTEYIENNGQLRSYDSQTTVFANSVVPVKISGNIPVNYASTLANLATQARNLRIENTALIKQAESLSEQLNNAEQTNDFQDELIDVSLMATDELYVMLEPLLAQPMMSSKNTQNVSDETTKNTQGGNAMVDAYVAMVIRGLKTIDEVPARYREEVRRILAELDK